MMPGEFGRLMGQKVGVKVGQATWPKIRLTPWSDSATSRRSIEYFGH